MTTLNLTVPTAETTEKTLALLYQSKNRINAWLDLGDAPYEEDLLLEELDKVCDRIERLEAPRYSNTYPCNF